MSKSTDLYKVHIYTHIILLIRTFLSNVELCMARGLCLLVQFETNILRNVIAVYVYPCYRTGRVFKNEKAMLYVIATITVCFLKKRLTKSKLTNK